MLTVLTVLNIILFPVSCRPVAQKTNEQANTVADTAVAGANEVAQATVEGVENAAMASGFVSVVSDVTSQCDIIVNKSKRNL